MIGGQSVAGMKTNQVQDDQEVKDDKEVKDDPCQHENSPPFIQTPLISIERKTLVKILVFSCYLEVLLGLLLMVLNILLLYYSRSSSLLLSVGESLLAGTSYLLLASCSLLLLLRRSKQQWLLLTRSLGLLLSLSLVIASACQMGIVRVWQERQQQEEQQQEETRLGLLEQEVTGLTTILALEMTCHGIVFASCLGSLLLLL